MKPGEIKATGRNEDLPPFGHSGIAVPLRALALTY